MVKKINQNLTAEQKLILFEEGTELAGTSELNHEKREGSFHCANCGVKLFDSKTKYESGSGWPSFYESLPDVFETHQVKIRKMKANLIHFRILFWSQKV